MSNAQRVFHGDFGRVALLDMDDPLVPHAHSECHVLLKATGADTFFSVRGRQQPLTDRTAVLVNAWEPHYYDHRPDAPHTLILALYIEPGWLAALQRSLVLSGRPDFFSRQCVELSPSMRATADALIAEMMAFGPTPQDQIEALLSELLISICESFSEWRHLERMRVASPMAFYDVRIRRANEYLMAHYAEEVRMDELAAQCGLSRAHFFALFKKSTGMTPHMVLNMIRMKKACDWLASARSGTLGNLSESLGFSEQGHFTRFFRNHLGAAPSQYQRVVDRYGRASMSS